jgi:hypothetical protein
MAIFIYGSIAYKMIKKIFLGAILFFIFGCQKYELPSEPRLSGRWRIDKVVYQRINGSDTLNQMTYFPGDQYIAPNDSTPLNTINVGFTEFSMDYAEIYFNSYPTFAGNIGWKNKYFYNVTEVNYQHPGFISFQTEKTNVVWKVLRSEKEFAVLQIRGKWNPNSIGFFGLQNAENYDDTQLLITRTGP